MIIWLVLLWLVVFWIYVQILFFKKEKALIKEDIKSLWAKVQSLTKVKEVNIDMPEFNTLVRLGNQIIDKEDIKHEVKVIL